MKNVLIIGSGGREHSLVKACLSSSKVESVIAAPGNGGICEEVACFNIGADDIPGLVDIAKSQERDFVIVGPEVPLSEGIVDALAEVGIPAYGPNKKAAQLEASKTFTKNFLFKYNIPTADSEEFTQSQEAIDYLKNKNEYPTVIKASGLAAGKGVIIAENEEEAITAIRSMLDGNEFGESGNIILIEEFLYGEEASITIMASGTDYVQLASSQDHKRIGVGDSGLNTGGMGAYAPAACVTEELNQIITDTITKPTLEGLKAEDIDYRGTLYIGVMITPKGPKVLEFNARFGDPETQVILPLLDADPVELMYACATGTLDPSEVKLKDKYAMVVVQAASGYPGDYQKGEKITIPTEKSNDAWVIHAGTKMTDNGDIVSNGGRVLSVVGIGDTLQGAADNAYELCAKVNFKSRYYRNDIGHRQLSREVCVSK